MCKCRRLVKASEMRVHTTPWSVWAVITRAACLVLWSKEYMCHVQGPREHQPGLTKCQPGPHKVPTRPTQSANQAHTEC